MYFGTYDSFDSETNNNKFGFPFILDRRKRWFLRPSSVVLGILSLGFLPLWSLSDDFLLCWGVVKSILHISSNLHFEMLLVAMSMVKKLN